MVMENILKYLDTIVKKFPIRLQLGWELKAKLFYFETRFMPETEVYTVLLHNHTNIYKMCNFATVSYLNKINMTKAKLPSWIVIYQSVITFFTHNPRTKPYFSF